MTSINNKFVDPPMERRAFLASGLGGLGFSGLALRGCLCAAVFPIWRALIRNLS